MIYTSLREQGVDGQRWVIPLPSGAIAVVYAGAAEKTLLTCYFIGAAGVDLRGTIDVGFKRRRWKTALKQLVYDHTDVDAVSQRRLLPDRRYRREKRFPAVDVSKNVSPNLRGSVWVEPTPQDPNKAIASANPLKKVWQTVLEAFDVGAAEDKCPRLPGWFRSFRKFARGSGNQVGTLDSAGFSLAMQFLADHQQRPLPFGVGFSSRWEAGRLRGETELGMKQRAAADAGIFLFFACRDPKDPIPDPIPGVLLVLLDEYLSLEVPTPAADGSSR